MVQILNKAMAAIVSSAAIVSAFPSADPAVVAERASCTFTTAAAAKSGKTSCTAIVLSNIAVPAGTTLDLTGLKSGTTVTFEGTTTFGYEEWSGPLVSVSGTNIVVKGTGAILDGNGAKYWDGKGSNGGKTKPKFFYAHSLEGTSSITGLTIKNSPVQTFSINSSSGLTLDNITIDNSAGDSLGHNTDAFDVGSSTDITISGAVVHNQDDCLAINSGTGITFTGGSCTGGHGLSIGSVGGRSDNVVKTVKILNSKIINSDNGVRIKSVSGATGSISDITYDTIALTNIAKYGIVIEQDYENGSPTGKPTSGVPITDVTIKGVTGSVKSSGTNVYILCASCSGWTWSGNTLSGGKTSSACKGVPTGAKC